MTLFNYDNCPCKNKCKSVLALANILPVDVCNLIGGYIRVTCFDCRYLMEEEEHFMRNRTFLKKDWKKQNFNYKLLS